MDEITFKLLDPINGMFYRAALKLLNSGWNGTLEDAGEILNLDGEVLDSVLCCATEIQKYRTFELSCSLDEK